MSCADRQSSCFLSSEPYTSHQTSSLRFINPMDYCLFTAAENYLVSPFMWDADHLPDDCGGVFGWWSRSKLPWFLVLLDLPGECTNSCVRMGSFVLVEVVGLGEEWWLACVFISSLAKDLFKGTRMVTAVWVFQAVLLPMTYPSLIPGVSVVNKGNWLVNWSLQPFCRNCLLYIECELGLKTLFWREFNAS